MSHAFSRVLAVGALALHTFFTPVANNAQAEGGEAISRLDALKASAGRIVLHYGEGIEGAGQIAEILNEKGYPAVAYAGGPVGMVELFVGKKPPLGKYDQNELDDGFLGGTAVRSYKEIVLGESPYDALGQRLGRLGLAA